MKLALYALFCLAPLVGLAGCGGVAEEKPPEKSAEMRPEDKKTAEGHMAEMRKMYMKGKKK